MQGLIFYSLLALPFIFSLVIKLRLKIWQIVSCMLTFSALGTILEMSTGVLSLTYLQDSFGVLGMSMVPLFMDILSCFGVCFRVFLMHCKDKTKMYRILIISALLLIPPVILSWNYKIEFGAFGEYYQQQYYHQTCWEYKCFFLLLD